MEQAVQSVIIPLPENRHDDLIAELCVLGYDGFEQTDTQLIAYIPILDFEENNLNLLLNRYNLTCSLSIIEKTNWNAVWESNFQPIRIGDKIGVRADFHPPLEEVEHELVITPRMSFGTGHHATTALMLENLLPLPLQDKTVLDFGTGTGILGILALRLGASRVLGIDNDPWCVENAAENCKMNGVKMNLILAETPPQNDTFDVVLANINLHLIQAHIIALRSCLKNHSTLLLSGLLTRDEPIVDELCREQGLEKIARAGKNGWLVLIYQPMP